MIGLPNLRQHVVEFIVGTGLVTDGVANPTSVNGPWTWVVPSGVAEIAMDGCAGGGGGAGGWNTGTQRAGGSGGGAALGYRAMRLPVRPNASLTVTIGAAGSGGAVASAGSFGGATTISGLGVAPMVGHNSTTNSWNPGVLTLIQGSGSNASTGTGSGTAGGIGSQFKFGFYNGGGLGVSNAASPPGGTATSVTADNQLANFHLGLFLYATTGASGGAASTSGSTAGGVGGFPSRSIFSINENNDSFPGQGGTDGTNSFGGGGVGGASMFGQSGNGGGNTTGTSQNAVAGNGYGFGGAGGGGSGAGASGGIGYVRFTYWSAN